MAGTFNSTTNRLKIGDSALTSWSGADGYTVHCIGRSGTADDLNWIYSCRKNNNAPNYSYGFFNRLNTASKWQWFVWGTNDSDAATSHNFEESGTSSTDTWYVLTGTYDTTGTSYFYKDGVQVASIDTSGDGLVKDVENDVVSSSKGDGRVRIGGYWFDFTATDAFFDGEIAEFAVWNRALAPGELKALGQGISPLLIPDGLHIYVPLDNSTNFRRDLCGNTWTNDSASPSNFVHPRIIQPQAQIIPFPPAAAVGRTVEATTATMSIADINATLNLKRELASTLATMGMADAAATIATGRSIDSSLATLAAIDLNATALTNRELNATLGTMSAAALAATLTADSTIEASLATLEATGNAADINLKRQVAATLATLEGATAAADIERKRVIECTTALLAITALKTSSIEGPVTPPQDALRRALIGCVGRGATRRRGL